MRSLDKIQVITITFNNYEELVNTLNSLSSAKDYIECLVINGGSCVKTKKYLDENHIKNITERDHGIADAFNKGFRNSKEKFVHILNSGDLLLDPFFYQEALKAFGDDNELSYVFSNIYYEHHELGKLLVQPNPKALKQIAHGMPFPHPGLIVKKEVFEKIGGFDTNFKIAMDYDFTMRMLNDFKNGKYINCISVLMDGRGVSSKNTLKSVLENYKALKKNQRLDIQSRIIIVSRVLRAFFSNKLVKKIIYKDKLAK